MALSASPSLSTMALVSRATTSSSPSTGFPSYISTATHRGLKAVRCQAENKDAKIPEATEKTETPQPTPLQTTPTPKPKPKKGFFDLLAFSGPAPERINGRLAMVGFASAMAVELSKGQDLSTQLSNGGLTWFVGTAAVLSLASLVPLLKEGTPEGKYAGGVMNSHVEMLNGRFAMLGMVALAFTEYLKGGPLV